MYQAHLALGADQEAKSLLDHISHDDSCVGFVFEASQKAFGEPAYVEKL